MDLNIQDKTVFEIQKQVNDALRVPIQTTPLKQKRTQDHAGNNSKGKSSKSKEDDSLKKEKLIISIDQTKSKNAVKAIKT